MLKWGENKEQRDIRSPRRGVVAIMSVAKHDRDWRPVTGSVLQAGIGSDSRWCQRPDDTRRLRFPCLREIYCIHCFVIVNISLESQILDLFFTYVVDL